MPTPTPPKFNPTTMAILGLIAAEPASGYELNRRMEISYGYFWRRARSHVFTEVKRLAGQGWVSGQAAATGARERTVYSITAAGRRALAAWLATPPDVFALEMEGLVRVYLAPFGTVDDLDQSLAAMQAQAETMLRIAGDVIPAYLAGQGPPPRDEMYQRAVLIDLLAHFAQLVHDWARRSRREVGRWDGDPKARDARARSLMKQLPRIEPPAADEAGRQTARRRSSRT
jgi:PadR family transcriptional regulator, regulatory protein AphA